MVKFARSHPPTTVLQRREKVFDEPQIALAIFFEKNIEVAIGDRSTSLAQR